MSSELTELERAAFSIWKPRYRGRVYDYYNNNEHVRDFLRCHFHRKIFRDFLRHSTRRQGLRGANQVGKSRIGEIMMMYLIEHEPGDMIMYDAVGDKTNDHMRNRFMPILKSVPAIGSIIRSLLATPAKRWDVKTKDIIFPGMIFRARPLNETWTQSVTVRYGMISDAALSEQNGQVRRAFIRSRQNEANDFWFVESQGGILDNGEPGDDFVEFMASTNEMKLFVRCRICGTRQRFRFQTERKEDTVFTPPTDVPSLDRDAWLSHHRTIFLSQDRRWAGFRHANRPMRFDDGTVDEDEIRRTTVYECPHCGGFWNDDYLTRDYLDKEAGLDDSWTPDRPNAAPGYLGYSLPAWINPKVSWGKCLVDFKAAMRAKKYGNLMPLQEFDTKTAAEDWDDRIHLAPTIPISPGSYDPHGLIENEFARDMAVDCQQDQDHFDRTGQSITGWFWFIARIYDKSGNSRQLARGYVKSVEDWMAVQRHWKIPNDRVVIDVNKWPTQIKMMAAQHREERKREKRHALFGNAPEIITWKLIQTENRTAPFKGSDGSPRAYSPERKEWWPVQDNAGNPIRIPLSTVRFNKTPIMQQLDAIRSGAPGMPKFEVLSREHLRLPNGQPDVLTLEMETGNRTYDMQMSSSYYVASSNEYKELRPDDHYYWCEQALLVRQALDGQFGQVGIYQPET